MGIVRDFSIASVEKLQGLVEQEAKERYWAPVEWFKDTFLLDTLDVRGYLDDMDAYHSQVIDKNNTGAEQLTQMLQKVADVDSNYADRLTEINLSVQSLDAKVRSIADMITPSVITADASTFTGISSYVINDYDLGQEDMRNGLDVLARQMSSELEVPLEWWASMLSAIGGLSVAVVGNCVVEPFLMVSDLLGYKDVRAGWDSLMFTLNSSASDPAWYYGGKMVGDAASMVIGAAEMAYGVSSALQGIMSVGEGFTLSPAAVAVGPETAGITIGVDAALILEGVLTAAGGIAVSAAGAVTAFSALNSFNKDWQSMQMSGGGGKGFNNLVRVESNKRANLIAQKVGYKNAEALKKDCLENKNDISLFDMFENKTTGEIILVRKTDSSIQISTGLFYK